MLRARDVENNELILLVQLLRIATILNICHIVVSRKLNNKWNMMEYGWARYNDRDADGTGGAKMITLWKMHPQYINGQRTI